MCEHNIFILFRLLSFSGDIPLYDTPFGQIHRKILLFMSPKFEYTYTVEYGITELYTKSS